MSVQCANQAVEYVRCAVLWLPPVIVHGLLLWSYWTFNFVLAEGLTDSAILRGTVCVCASVVLSPFPGTTFVACLLLIRAPTAAAGRHTAYLADLY